MRLLGKKALITGGTSGIGLETAKQFLLEGAQVAITGRSVAGLEEAQQVLGNSVIRITADSGSIPDQLRIANILQEQWGGVDVVLINAGDVTHRPLSDWDEETYDRLMATNLKGPFFLLQALLPLLNNPASVIVTGSVSARIGLPQSSAYAASKAGLISLARTLSGELVTKGIRVNALSPGPTETPALGKLGLNAEAEQALKKDIRNLVPLGRMGTVKELAKAAVFLASDESSYMLGTELLVDGGVGNI